MPGDPTFTLPRPAEAAAGDFTEADDPFAVFEEWFAEARRSEPNDPHAMALATADADGLPDVRMVLMNGYDRKGFVFYTNLESAKGRQLEGNPKAALLFHWKSLRRQVRVRGPVVAVSGAEADAYFASRPRESRIGAWASRQSRALESRTALERAVAEVTARHEGGEVPRPPHWSGFRIVPTRFELWHDRPFRLHDRIVFSRATLDSPWTRVRLNP